MCYRFPIIIILGGKANESEFAHDLLLLKELTSDSDENQKDTSNSKLKNEKKFQKLLEEEENKEGSNHGKSPKRKKKVNSNKINEKTII